MITITSAKERLNRGLVQHPHFDDALRRIMSEIEFPTDTKLLLVVGPTGVGKTRLREQVEKHILKLAATKQANNPGRIPCVSFEVPSIASNHRFSWREFYYAYMTHLEAPFVLEPNKLARASMGDWSRSPEQAVLNALKYRQPSVVLLDEANHFASVASGRILLEQMTRIKSFANRSGVLHVCFGTYELVQMANLSGQLARRCDIVNFGRYRAGQGNEIEYANFKVLLRTFQKSMGVAPQLDMSSIATYFHERSIGCAGIVKTWLMKALAHAAKAGRAEITHDDLRASELSVEKLRRMLEETKLGEDYLTESPNELELLRQDLGHTAPKLKAILSQSELWEERMNSPAGIVVTKPKLKPGEQSPRRDPAGGAYDGSMGGPLK